MTAYARSGGRELPRRMAPFLKGSSGGVFTQGKAPPAGNSAASSPPAESEPGSAVEAAVPDVVWGKREREKLPAIQLSESDQGVKGVRGGFLLNGRGDHKRLCCLPPPLGSIFQSKSSPPRQNQGGSGKCMHTIYGHALHLYAIYSRHCQGALSKGGREQTGL